MKKVLFIAALFMVANIAMAESPIGLWDATINFNGTTIPFKLEISGENSKISGAFLNGNERETSTSGKFEQGALVLNFDHYAAALDASITDGILEGLYGPFQKKYYTIQAKRHEELAKPGTEAPSIDGLWEIVRSSNAGQSAGYLTIRQSGAETVASILQKDGDTGEIAGVFKDGKFTLSHFSGARPALLVLTPQSDGALAVRLTDSHGIAQYSALRPEQARAKGISVPRDPNQLLGSKDAVEPLQFRFPDASGRMISSTDSRFRRKVLLVNISGTWSPNCHDAAPFLEDVYRKYRSQGLEIVSLTFEEASQIKDPTRLRAFIKKFGIEYPVLIAGEPNERDSKIPQSANFAAWPTTFFIGRDGAVRFVRTGFPGQASGPLLEKAKEQFTAQVERLLAEGFELAKK